MTPQRRSSRLVASFQKEISTSDIHATVAEFRHFQAASEPSKDRIVSSPILFVANSSWNLEHFRGPLIRALEGAGHRVIAAVPDGQSAVAGLETWHFPLQPEGTAPLTEMRTLLALLRIMREARPGAVLSFTPKGNIYAGLAARALGIPLLPNISGLGTGFIRGGMLQRIQSALYREALRPARTVFLQNEDDSALFQKLGLVRSDQVAMLPGSGVDCRRFRPSPLPSQERSAAKLLFVGRLLGDKGVRELAEAMRQLKPRYPNLELTLVGGLGAANRTAISAAEVSGWEEEGLLRHVGATDDVRPFIAAADAMVLPSYREGMPRALLEGAAMGRPLLASDVPGCRQLVDDGVNGLLFEARSATSLAAAIERFLNADYQRRQSWGDAARKLATSRYDEKLVIDAYLSRVIALTGKAG